jgi:beta-phosphoglucomutase family hydrolase
MINIPAHIQGLVFDCDGTIADTMPLHYRAWVTALKEHDADFPEAMFYEMAGMPTPRIIQILNERHGWNMPIAETAELKESMFLELLPQVTAIEPVATIVRAQAGSLPMAVATGGTRAVCARTLEFLGLISYFQAIVTADDVEHGKPAPDIFIEAARRLNISPELCMAFEDADLGVQAAHDAGMHVIDIRNWGK